MIDEGGLALGLDPSDTQRNKSILPASMSENVFGLVWLSLLFMLARTRGACNG